MLLEFLIVRNDIKSFVHFFKQTTYTINSLVAKKTSRTSICVMTKINILKDISSYFAKYKTNFS